MRTALLEVGLEELPASEFHSILKQLEEKSAELLKAYRVSSGSVEVFVGSRRFGVILKNLPERQEDFTEEKKGPPLNVAYDENGKPTRALEGFLRNNNASLENVVHREGYVYLSRVVEGKPVEEVLPDLFRDLVLGLNFRKPMRWGSGEHEYIRPVHWIVAMVDGRVLDLEIFGLRSSRISYGKRYHAGSIEIPDSERYYESLKKGFVISSHLERKKFVLEQIDEFEKRSSMKIERDEELIEEIVAITEYPRIVVGQFDRKYLELPEEIIVTAVKHHQRSFIAHKGTLTNTFVAFQDGPQPPENVVKGYERVINARLEDARYYFQKDLETPLEKMNEKLKEIVFQEKLGTLYDKVERIKKISQRLCEDLKLPGSFTQKVLEAASICKADIASKVVYEFPELQGVMGRIYALREGINEEIATAIEDHYSEEPQTVIGSILGIADRIDTIVGNFAIGNVPTSSKDPYGLKSKADTIFRIIRKNEWDISLEELLTFASSLVGYRLSEELETFFAGRFYQFLINELGISFDVARAVNHLWKKPLRGILSAEALQEISEKPEFQDLFVGFERVHNITKNHDSTKFDGALFEKEEEKKLMNKFYEVKEKVLKALERLNYREALQYLIELKPYIDEYFDNVFVMVKRDDLRVNRLSFLKNIDELFMMVGDMTYLVKRSQV
ncbi:glycyl-tRNA synthetase subunit beta [Thermotoga maritima MSB8]|uniref:Glycine--tRNA ligase beta subunit n=1 Tax=Thermotoga maritima (strain ATCC 43589 / DSM 3109 / JCM 10099 / NBRC 100826 / MSB8) TaxID=243274 RepID=SYGB_THEMA|nr:glycine--tRNA ligase subunit beta [Thermotoga maritima]Q9WY60.1 RecName: Full=Glycine--tRNA ligase beta subunit; AltName: Full=Glycyl-tRNA synthetase beta subunit; Short=GlyRS [Thermotoga maritima MSB8]AAD35309.1 glycyl-tRNA synthetase, beta subunit [Thermotoga maritima MSB8]AGL49141.1 Glycyl-tRNA synthetase beta chain [Thermotoga maritima MSB8]AHD18019.1 glycyl-tRNA synthetase subunit beta [Thermotoga maritima MSB8]AKE26156.1 glycyl-tRNA synthetase subunit beta [Thermotoga maritima]AKE280